MILCEQSPKILSIAIVLVLTLADQVYGSMKPRHLNCLAHFGDPPDGSIDVRESVYMYIYKEKIVREHLTGPQHYPDNELVSGTRGEVSRNQEEEVLVLTLPS
ncbi:hypothetical protein AVEN_15422-1 [Araneus ventricosus]|uniref:Uncharacterized protein n=1 Tax=Araneus ventricosus TaxID=182803 RepID=A0A4Y2CTA6_ARAVE|nr:hypothetical protein AVEN_15422-1 [Araneus ventricosus]